MNLKEEIEEALLGIDVVDIVVNKNSDVQGKKATDIIVSFKEAGRKWQAVWTFTKDLALSNERVAELLRKAIWEDVKHIRRTGEPR